MTTWNETRKGCWANPAGYRIAASRTTAGWVYCAFAPEITDAEFEALLKVRYPIGERVPQRQALIGCYPTAAEARAACAHHAGRAAA